MELYHKRYEMLKKVRLYLTENKDTITREYKVKIPANIRNNFPAISLSAWILVNASKILMAETKECEELKDMVKEYLLLNQQIAVKDSLTK